MKCWLPWTLLAVLVVGFIALVAYMRGQQADWLAHDRGRVKEIDNLVEQAAQHARSADLWEAKAIALDNDREAARVALEQSRKKVRALVRDKPTTVADCVVELAKLDGHILLLEDALELEGQKVLALQASLAEQQSRADALEQAWKLERVRSEGLKKMTKRDKVKKAFIAIGALSVGGVIGWGIGRATQ